MVKEINTILVPVDFSDNTSLAIAKALDFCAEQMQVTIHLYHIHRVSCPSFASVYTRALRGYSRQEANRDIAQAKNRLELLAASIRQRNHRLHVVSWVGFGEKVQEGIIKKARQIRAELIVIGKNAGRWLLPFFNTVRPVILSAATGLPVLTCRPGSMQQPIRTVVLPVSTRFPASKLAIIHAFRQKIKIQLRLVMFENDRPGSYEAKKVLVQTLRAFRAAFSNPVHFETLAKGNKARRLLEYCQRVDADVLIVEPGEETRIGTWSNSQIADHVPRRSGMQVISIC